MFKRNLVVIGGLVAGAFLLPSLAVAGGSVSGSCVNCHTMHNSQNGVARFTNVAGNLLGGTGCAGCHAKSGLENISTGAPSTDVKAPQVDNDGATAYILNGGYFKTTGGVDANQHNVAGIATKDVALNYNPPGGAARTSLLGCQDCHTSTGHHTTATNKYRMLAGTGRSDASAQTVALKKSYGASAAAVDKAAGARSSIVYQATDMNLFCAKCHGTFHTAANQGGPAAWVRHPTDVQVTNSTNFPSIRTFLANADTDQAPVGSTLATPTATAAGTDGTVMCISCHVPHGGPYADLLAFNYAANRAGGNTVSDGCETCHSYSSAGM